MPRSMPFRNKRLKVTDKICFAFEFRDESMLAMLHLKLTLRSDVLGQFSRLFIVATRFLAPRRRAIPNEEPKVFLDPLTIDIEIEEQRLPTVGLRLATQ